MSLDKRNTDKQQAKKLHKDLAEHSKQSMLYMLPALLLSIVAVLIASGLIWFKQAEHHKVQYAEKISAWGHSYAAALNQRLAFIQADTRSAASNPLLTRALQNPDSINKRSAERSLLHRAGVVDAYLHPAGQTLQDLQRTAPINFAALDLLQRAEQGSQPAPEALLIKQRWLLYSAVQLEQATAPGSLLLTYELSSLLSGLPASTPQDLQITLQQQFANAPVQVLSSSGQAAAEPISQRFATQHPNWTVIVTAPNTPPALSALHSSLLTALASALLLILVAFYLLHRRIQQLVKTDTLQLRKNIKDWAQGKSIHRAVFHFSALQQALHNLKQKSPGLSTTKKPSSTADSAIAQQPSIDSSPIHSPHQPLDIDILDIDILDDDVFALEQTHSAMQAASAAHNVPLEIFRAYDIRGIVGQTLTTDTAYWIGRAVGSESIAKGEPNVVVGRDGRLSGPDMVQALTQGLTDCGCTVTDLGMVPTPVLYFATHVLEATSGVMVTGSHNPPDYNGFKIVIAGETLANERVTALHSRIINNELSSGSGTVGNVEMLQDYLQHIQSDIALAKPMTVVVDCGNGVGGVIGPQLLEALGCTVIPLYCEVDGTFPNHHPDPGKPENLQELIARVKSENADLGIAFDGDADRLGVVTNSGRIIHPDHLMMLFAKDVLSRNPGADIIFDVKCTRRLATLISAHGGRPIMWKTGHSLIKAKMKETGALLAGEMSGHIFFKERWFGFDDGIYSAARLLEILSLAADNADQIFAGFPVNLTTPEINIEVTEDNKFQIIERLQSEANWGEASLTTLDGIRADFPNSWGLVRASNTTPMLVLRFEGESADDLAQIKTLFREQLLAIVPELELPF